MKLSCLPYRMVDFTDERSLGDWMKFAAGVEGLDAIDILDVDSDSRWSLIAFIMEQTGKPRLPVAMLCCAHALIKDQYHMSAEQDAQSSERIKNDVRLAKYLNVPLLRYGVAWGWLDYQGLNFNVNYEEIVEHAAAVLKAVLPFAEKHNVKLLLENHDGDVTAKKEFFNTLFAKIASPWLGINFDFVNTLFYPGQEPEDFLEDPAIFERACGFHACNLETVKGKSGKLGIANGKLNALGLLARIRQKGYDGWITFEYSGYSKEEIVESVKRIREVWAKHA